MKSNAEIWRQSWAEICNAYLSRNEYAERIDHRSYKRQGIDKIPTVHLGVAASQMERKGIKTELGNKNRAAEVTNSQMKQLKARIRKCKDWIYSQPIENTPNMVSVFSRISEGKNLNAQWAKIADLKTQAKVLMFLQNNKITDVSQLADKIENIHQELYDVSDKIKKTDRRIGTLNVHLEIYDEYKKHRAIYKEYCDTKPKKQETFYNKHFSEISAYKEAKQYLDSVMNGRTKIPIDGWKAELKTLTAERISLSEKYHNLKDDVRNIEILRRGVESLMKENERGQEQTRKRNMEL